MQCSIGTSINFVGLSKTLVDDTEVNLQTTVGAADYLPKPEIRCVNGLHALRLKVQGNLFVTMLGLQKSKSVNSSRLYKRSTQCIVIHIHIYIHKHFFLNSRWDECKHATTAR